MLYEFLLNIGVLFLFVILSISWLIFFIFLLEIVICIIKVFFDNDLKLILVNVDVLIRLFKIRK